MDIDTTDFQYVTRDGDADIQFEGEILAEIDNSSERTETPNARWVELRLYRTQAGAFVCERIRYENERRPVSDAAVCSTVGEVTDFFGFGRLSKELYELAPIETAMTVL